MITLPQCMDCKHFDGERNSAGVAVCTAFPEGIPKEIFIKGKDHIEPFPGDHGIQFEADDSPVLNVKEEKQAA